MDYQHGLHAQFLELCDEIAPLVKGFDRVRAHGLLTGIAAGPWYTEGELVLEQFGLEADANDLPDFVDDIIADMQEAMSVGVIAPFLGEPADEAAITNWAAGFGQALDLERPKWSMFRAHSQPIDGFLRYLKQLADDTGPSSDLDPPSDLPPSLPELLQALYTAASDLLDGSPDDDEEWMGAIPAPPAFDNTELAAMSYAELFDLLLNLGDKVPRSLFDAAVAKGDALLPLLSQLIEDDAAWEDDGDLWWGLHHAIHILGALPDKAAGEALIRAMLKANRYPDHGLWDGFADKWPAMFANKSEDVIAPLQAIVRGADNDPFLRISAMEALLSRLAHQDPDAMETEIDVIADIMASAPLGAMMSQLIGHILLANPRDRHRNFLEETAKNYADQRFRPFDLKDVTRAFEKAPTGTARRQPPDPWSFYDDKQIRSRQRRWIEEHQRAAEQDFPLNFSDPNIPYEREAPKVGRNDPCPCGSGKKFKKCCLH